MAKGAMTNTELAGVTAETVMATTSSMPRLGLSALSCMSFSSNCYWGLRQLTQAGALSRGVAWAAI
ncbi:hypothetical protein D3C80_2053180 [compost metagenome]